MRQSASPGQRSTRHRSVSLASLVVLACAVGIALLAAGVSQQIDTQSSAGSDNLQWGLSQVEIELLHLELATDNAIHQPQVLPDMRKRFDVFYSRIKTLQVGRVFVSLRQNSDFAASFARLEAFIARTTPLMDGPPDVLTAALPQMKQEERAIIPDSRIIALAGLQAFARLSDLKRAAVKQTLIELAALTLALVVALLATLVRVLVLDRRNRVKAAENVETLVRLDSVVATSLDAVITLNDQGLVVDFNPAACQTFGYAREAVLGCDLGLLVPRATAQGEPQLPPMSEALPVGRRRMRVTALHSSGAFFPAEVSLSTASGGSEPQHVIFLRDLSQQVEAEQALVDARDKALAGEKAKADLLVVMSHEIRTPLNGMIGTIELMEGTELAPHQREYLRIMAASGRLLMHHVNDVLDIARLDSGKATLSVTPVDLGHLVDEVIENQRSASLSVGNRLIFEPEPAARHLVLTDEVQLRQVLMNLVGNAVKFTHNGEITIRIRHLTTRGPTEMTVCDTGIGIEPQDMGRIFEDFVTLDPSYARHASGTGLGLGIVRRIVTRMGGMISVDSTPGRGSTFRVSLPLTILDRVAGDFSAGSAFAATEDVSDGDTAELTAGVTGPAISGAEALDPRQPADGLAGGGRLDVLVVEDNDFNRLIVRDLLVQEGHLVTEARNGTEGVRLAAERTFDAILMDISMPGIDGLQAAELIRKGAGASARSTIVALTAHALQSETDSFLAAGMQDVLIKPITREALRAVLVDCGKVAVWAAGRPTGAGTGGATATAAGRIVTGLPDVPARGSGALQRKPRAARSGGAEPNLPLIDVEVLAQLHRSLGRDKADQMIERFIADTETRMIALHDHINQPDAAADLIAEVHRMTGTAAMFGATAFHARLYAMEDMAKRGARSDARAGLPGLATLWHATANAFRDRAFLNGARLNGALLDQAGQ